MIQELMDKIIKSLNETGKAVAETNDRRFYFWRDKWGRTQFREEAK